MNSPEFLMAALPYISAGFSVLQGIAGYSSAKTNEARAKEEGRAAIAAGNQEKARQQRINMARQGTIEADAAAQGSIFEGSPMLSYLESVKQGALEAEDFSYRGRLTNYSKRMEAADYRQRAAASLFSGFGGAASSLIPVFGTPKKAPVAVAGPDGFY